MMIEVRKHVLVIRKRTQGPFKWLTYVNPSRSLFTHLPRAEYDSRSSRIYRLKIMVYYGPDEPEATILLERNFLAGDLICGFGFGKLNIPPSM